ncbi:MAG: PP2C family protein-serine/threonine phosphatase, partial [Dehalococcoidia bacterium]
IERLVDNSAAQTYRVRADTAAGNAALTLRFDDAQRLTDLRTAIDALRSPDGKQGPELPQIIDGGSDPERGTYVVLARPDGDWHPIAGQDVDQLSPTDAAWALEQLLGVADRAAACGRLLLLAPSQVLISRDELRMSVPQPEAPALPLAGPLLADPGYLAPELSGGGAAASAWPASAYAAAATVHAATGNALGYPAGWHALMGQLLAPSPADRPATLAEALVALHAAAKRRFISAHRVAWLTDIGRHHPVNQDAGGVWTWQRWDGTPVTLAIVADGVSAGEHSEAASALTVELFRAQFDQHWQDRDLSPDRADQLLSEAGIEAQRQICEMPFDDFDSANATTLVAVCVLGGTATGIWCGDSRAYGATSEGVRQLTRDHSWVNIMVDSGRMSLDHAKADPRAHVIARWLGISDPPHTDPGFDRFRCELAAGDHLLVCTDGLYMYFDQPYGSEDELAAAIYDRGDDIMEATRQMVQTALDRGGFDNITAVVVALA